jgi:hypothetical protein
MEEYLRKFLVDWLQRSQTRAAGAESARSDSVICINEEAKQISTWFRHPQQGESFAFPAHTRLP